jgi:DNA-binding SARP family transcriptional activator/predicted ATPase
MARLTLQVLGGFAMRRDSGPAVRLPRRKAEALLTYLALPPGRAHPRDKLATLLWGDTGEDQARQSLRQALAALRQALPRKPRPVLLADHDTVALDAAAVDVDAHTFERRCASSRAEDLERGLALYQGDLLDGIRVTGAAFDDWVRAERARLRQLAQDGLARLLALQTRVADTERAIQTASRLLALDPLQEPVHRALMRLYARQGRRAAALRQYQLCVDGLQRELRAEPEAETRRVYREILHREPFRRAAVNGPRDRSPARPAARVPNLPVPESRLIGRTAEMARLREAWIAARRGQGRVVIVVGEAGIGKSRLLVEVAAEASEHGGRVLVGRCHESEQILPFGPWVDAFRSGHVLADASIRDGLASTWRAEIARLLPEFAEPGLPAPTDDRLRLFESVALLVERLAATQPTVVMLEDAHWGDEMSLRLLAFVGRRIAGARVLLIVTVREEEPASAEVVRLAGDELARERHCESLTLTPLSRADTEALVRALARPGADAAQVWSASDGNPFLAVETLRALQETGAADSGPVVAPRIREVIAQRLDRLSAPSRELVEVASVIGRDFDFVLLQRAASVDERDAARGVEELVRRRVMRVVGERFDFAHDRIREVAVSRLLPPRRSLVHREIARAMEELYAADLDPHYAALAAHYRHGEAWLKALTYLHLAGTQALTRSASAEAIGHFSRGIELLSRLPDTPVLSRQALMLYTGLGAARQMAQGLAAPEVEHAYTQAYELSQRVGDTPELVPVLYGLWRFYRGRSDLGTAREIGETLLRMAQQSPDPALAVIARYPLGVTSLWRGEIAAARQHLAEVPFTAHQFRGPAFRMGPDLGVAGGGHTALTWWFLGYPDRAASRMGEALALASDLSHSYSVASARCFAACICQLRRDVPGAREHAAAAVALAKEQNFPYWAAWGACFDGWALVMQDGGAEGMTQLRGAIADFRATGAAVSVPLLCTLLAEVAIHLDRADVALGALNEAQTLMERHDERLCEAEIHRLRGDLMIRQDGIGPKDAEACFERALEVARRQEAKSLELRAATSLARLWRAEGRRDDARRLLGDVYAWFTEGFETGDLRDAQAILGELS